MNPNKFPFQKTPDKYLKEKDFEIAYEFLPSQEVEARLSQAYELVFEEIEKMLAEEKGYEQKSTNN